MIPLSVYADNLKNLSQEHQENIFIQFYKKYPNIRYDSNGIKIMIDQKYLDEEQLQTLKELITECVKTVTMRDKIEKQELQVNNHINESLSVKTTISNNSSNSQQVASLAPIRKKKR